MTEPLFYLYSQQPHACGVGSCQNGGTCLEQCNGNRQCICTEGYTGAYCENKGCKCWEGTKGASKCMQYLSKVV